MRAILLAAAALRLLGQEPVITRQGNYWVYTESASVPVEPHGQLQVEARGHIVVHGDGGDRVFYRLVQRVPAASESEARQLFGIRDVAARRLGSVTRVVVQQNSSPKVANQLDINAPRTLAVVTLQTQLIGGVDAYDLDGSVNARTPSGDIRLDRIRGWVAARAGSGNLFFGHVGGIEECLTGAGDITVENAVGGVKACRTGAGELIVKQAGAPVVLENEGGNITVERAAAAVEAHAISGLIRIGQAGGEVIADSRGGAIQVGSARGVKAESAQGPVRLRGPAGPMNVSTAAGSIIAELMAGVPIQDSWLAAGSGDVTVSIPSNFPVSVMVTNDRGGYPQIMSDFPEVRPAGLTFAKPQVVAQGAINGGGPVLHINAGTGVVYLRRSK
ncbi:MAG TPA: hypothetical protein VKV74_13265 [Bryobacteraceae bacterium]|nr:hypothetical protein [Bryobacteraceae bacterium]